MLFLAVAPLIAADAAVETEVPAGQSKSIRIRSLAAGAQLAVRVVTSGRVLIALVSAREIREPRPGSKPLFRAVVPEKVGFRVRIVEAGDYVLVLSNRGGKESVKVHAEIRVSAPPKRLPPDPSPRPHKA